MMKYRLIFQKVGDGADYPMYQRLLWVHLQVAKAYVIIRVFLNFIREKYIISYSGQHTKEITKMTAPGAILLCVRAPVGEVNLTDRPICIGRGLAAIKTLDMISEQFFFYWIQAFKSTLVSKATGTTFVAVTTDVVKNLLIPVPPLKEQMHILTQIRSACSELDKVEKSLS